MSSYDNRFSGALFPTSDASKMSGPMQLDEKSEPKHTIVLNIGKAGTTHTAQVLLKGKKKPTVVMTLEVVSTGSTKGPAARAVGSHPKLGRLNFCLWKQGNFYQVKPDHRAVVDANPL